MNKLLLIILLGLGSMSTNISVAQENHAIHCQMSVEDVLLNQPWDIDEPSSEFARYIAIDLFEELNALYEKVNASDLSNIDGHIHAIEEAIVKANELGMNYSMFDEDLEFVASLK